VTKATRHIRRETTQEGRVDNSISRSATSNANQTSSRIGASSNPSDDQLRQGNDTDYQSLGAIPKRRNNPSNASQSNSSGLRGPRPNGQGTNPNGQGATSNGKGTNLKSQGATSSGKGTHPNVKGASSNSQGTSSSGEGASSNSKGARQNVEGAGASNQGAVKGTSNSGSNSRKNRRRRR